MGNKMYKPSMFNRLISKNNETILYNTRAGINKIKSIPIEYRHMVFSWLQYPTVYDDNSLYCMFVNDGFLVPIDCDEKQIRDYIQVSHLTNPRLHLIIHITQDCNFRCVYCYMEHTTIMINEDVQKGIVNFLKKNIHKYSSVFVSWFGGEPLLGIDIIENLSSEFIKICKEMRKSYIAMITTNGYLLTAKNMQRLIKVRVFSVQLSIDGFKETHDVQRPFKDGSPTFDQIMTNLLAIRDYVDNRFLSIILRVNVSKKHSNSLTDFYNYLDDLFKNDSRFSLTVGPVANLGGENILQMQNELIDDMNDVYEDLALNQSNMRLNTNMEDLGIGGYVCSAKMHNKFTIGCDGSVHKCDEAIDVKIGQLYSNGYMDMQIDELAKWLAPVKSSQCDNCFFSLCCYMERCPRTRIISGNISECRRNKNEIDSLIWTASIVYGVERLSMKGES